MASKPKFRHVFSPGMIGGISGELSLAFHVVTIMVYSTILVMVLQSDCQTVGVTVHCG